MSQGRPGVGDKVKVVGGGTRNGHEGTIYKDDCDHRPYRIEFSDGKCDHWFAEAHVEWVELLEKGKEGKVSIWRSESCTWNDSCNAVLSWNTIILPAKLMLFLPFSIY